MGCFCSDYMKQIDATFDKIFDIIASMQLHLQTQVTTKGNGSRKLPKNGKYQDHNNWYQSRRSSDWRRQSCSQADGLGGVDLCVAEVQSQQQIVIPVANCDEPEIGEKGQLESRKWTPYTIAKLESPSEEFELIRKQHCTKDGEAKFLIEETTKMEAQKVFDEMLQSEIKMVCVTETMETRTGAVDEVNSGPTLPKTVTRDGIVGLESKFWKSAGKVQRELSGWGRWMKPIEDGGFAYEIEFIMSSLPDEAYQRKLSAHLKFCKHVAIEKIIMRRFVGDASRSVWKKKNKEATWSFDPGVGRVFDESPYKKIYEFQFFDSHDSYQLHLISIVPCFKCLIGSPLNYFKRPAGVSVDVGQIVSKEMVRKSIEKKEGKQLSDEANHSFDMNFFYYIVALLYEDGLLVDSKELAYDCEQISSIVGTFPRGKFEYTIELDDVAFSRNNGNPNFDGDMYGVGALGFGGFHFNIRITQSDLLVNTLGEALRGWEFDHLFRWIILGNEHMVHSLLAGRDLIIVPMHQRPPSKPSFQFLHPSLGDKTHSRGEYCHVHGYGGSGLKGDEGSKRECWSFNNIRIIIN